MKSKGFLSVVLLIVGALIIGASAYLYKGSLEYKNPFVSDKTGFIATQTEKPQPVSTPTPTPTPVISVLKEKVLLTVPFVAQAPTGRWSDPRQQDGCEEAASYMAYLWATGQSAPSGLAAQEQKITEISDWEESTYGSYHDTSAEDTYERILKGYFEYENAEVVYDVTILAMQQALSDGKLVLVPANGQRLGNPHFTAPGPERHFLVVIGYDQATGEFITNDNGTRQGKGFRYKEQVLLNAIRDYPTGNHAPITSNKKAMIVVSKEQ